MTHQTGPNNEVIIFMHAVLCSGLFVFVTDVQTPFAKNNDHPGLEGKKTSFLAKVFTYQSENYE